jgi:hypothetical protein
MTGVRNGLEANGGKRFPRPRKVREFRSMKRARVNSASENPTLKTIVGQIKRSPEAIIGKAARPNLSIKRTAKGK